MAPIGPSLPPNVRLAAPAGPQLPPGLAASIAPATNDSDDDDDFGPSLPPDLLVARSSKPVIGPSLPSSFPPSASQKRETPLSVAYSDDDDDFGPMPLPAGYSTGENDAVRAFREREDRAEEKKRNEERDKGKIKREEWMLVPPKEISLLASMPLVFLF